MLSLVKYEVNCLDDSQCVSAVTMGKQPTSEVSVYFVNNNVFNFTTIAFCGLNLVLNNAGKVKNLGMGLTNITCY